MLKYEEFLQQMELSDVLYCLEKMEKWNQGYQDQTVCHPLGLDAMHHISGVD